MNIDRLMKPKSIAFVGASENPSIGQRIMLALKTMGYEGKVYPINPKYKTVLGWDCYPSLKDLPEGPDAVAFCVGYQRVIENYRMLPEIGAGSATIFDGGFGESGEEGMKLQQEIIAISREAGIALCGPNCQGVFNPAAKTSTYSQGIRDFSGLVGNVGLVAQSGSACIAMLSDIRRYGFSVVVSAGNEAVTGAADYLDWLVDDPNTKVIAGFFEAIREPDKFVAALDRADKAGKPVIVLMVGKSERTRAAITGHTGGLAGESSVFSQVLKAHRAIEVDDIEEMKEVVAVCQGKYLPKGRRMGVITASGGLAELILDLSTEKGLELPALNPKSRAEIEAVTGHISGDANPMDVWGHGEYARNLPAAHKVLNEAPEMDVIVESLEGYDLNPMGRPGETDPLPSVQVIAEYAAQSQKPHYLLNICQGIMQSAQAKFLREKGVVVITGTRQGMGAIDLVAKWNMPRPPVRKGVSKGKANIAGRPTVNEYDAKQMLAAYGAPVSKEKLATTLDAAKDAAKSIGYPVVLKAVSDDIPHKTEYGLVKVGLADEAALAAAWAELEANMKKVGKPVKLAGFVVQEMVKDGVEMFAGVSRDPQFGLTLAVGFGGIEIEITRDFALRPLPLREGDAEAMIAELRGVKRLGPVRGAPPADVASLAKAIYGLADFAMDNADGLAEIDLNPIKVRHEGKGCVIVDALIVPQK